MAHVYQLSDVNLLKPSFLTIGVFDGVHLGHQYLIKKLVQKAHDAGCLAVVLTFFPHPDIVLRGLQGRYYLTSPEQRAELLLGLGVDYVVTHPFNEQTRTIRAADFVDELVHYLRIQELWVGKDFAMGYKREGDVAFLQAQGSEKGFTVSAIELVHAEEGDNVISSTRIREALENGELEQANNGLGRPYEVTGTVVHGEKRGRTIGFPTANIDVWEQQVLPSTGVYAGWAQVDGERFKAVTNIGVRPTFEGTSMTIEAHLLDFSRDIYEKEINLSFVTRLRGEKKFNGIQELIAQIQADVEQGRRILQNEGF